MVGPSGTTGPQGSVGAKGISGQQGTMTVFGKGIRSSGGAGGVTFDELVNTDCENHFIPPFSTTISNFYTTSSNTNASTSYQASSLKN